MGSNETLTSSPLVGAVVGLVIVGVVGSGVGEARGPRPCKRKYGCYEHLRKTPLQRLNLPGTGEVRGGVFFSRRRLPGGPRAAARPGDYYLRSGALVAAVRKNDGVLVDLAPLGPAFVDRLGWAAVRLCDDKGSHPIKPRRIRVADRAAGRRKARATLRVEGTAGGLDVVTRYRILPTPGSTAGGALELQTWVTNRGRRPRPNLRVCDHLGLGNTPLFVAGHGELRPDAKTAELDTRFCGRRDGPVSHLLMALDREPMRLRISWGTPRGAFDPSVDASYGRADLGPGKTQVTRRLLVAVRGPLHAALAAALAATRRKTRALKVVAPADDARLVVLDAKGKPLLATDTRATSKGNAVTLRLPTGPARGALALRAWQPGVGAGPKLAVPADDDKATEAALSPKLPPSGTVALEVVERTAGAAKEERLPAKVQLTRLGRPRASTDPSIPPGLFGRGAGLRVDDVVYTAGRETLRLAPGRYRALASHGFEHDLGRASFTVRAGRTTRARLTLRRAVRWPPKGGDAKAPAERWLRADLHLHGDGSFDSPLAPATRLTSAAAVGLDLIVATDHNAVTDYRRALRATPARFGAEPTPLQRARALLAGRLTTVVGVEVTTQGNLFGHFNVFPLPPGSRPPEWRDGSPDRLLREIARRRGGGRATRPGIGLRMRGGGDAKTRTEARASKGPPLVQVNHPRMGSIGYFDQMGLDPATGKAAAPGYRDGLVQLLEVFNGDRLEDHAVVDRCTADWLALLARGRRITATGNSDAHRLAVQDAGYPRNYVLLAPGAQIETGAGDKAGNAREKALVAALAAQRSFVTTGPLVRLSIDGQPLGATVTRAKASKGAQAKPVTARIEVHAAPWVDVSQVELLEGKKVLHTFRVGRSRAARRFARNLTLRPPKGGAFYVVRVRGRRPDPTQARPNVLPFALTNPIWVAPVSPGSGG